MSLIISISICKSSGYSILKLIGSFGKLGQVLTRIRGGRVSVLVALRWSTVRNGLFVFARWVSGGLEKMEAKIIKFFFFFFFNKFIITNGFKLNGLEKNFSVCLLDSVGDNFFFNFRLIFVVKYRKKQIDFFYIYIINSYYGRVRGDQLNNKNFHTAT